MVRHCEAYKSLQVDANEQDSNIYDTGLDEFGMDTNSPSMETSMGRTTRNENFAVNEIISQALEIF
jgi:hypothetical protein